MNTIAYIAYLASLIALLAIIGLSIAKLFTPSFVFWPPPSTPSWQHTIFRNLFRIFLFGLVVLSVIQFDQSKVATWQLSLGLPLLFVGFGLALYWTNYLGWRNAFGESEGLIVTGIYRWSRNPIYVVTIVGLIGWGLIVSSWSAGSLLALWGFCYVLAPFLEEPWLEAKYGSDFTLYKRRTPRYFGIPMETRG